MYLFQLFLILPFKPSYTLLLLVVPVLFLIHVFEDEDENDDVLILRWVHEHDATVMIGSFLGACGTMAKTSSLATSWLGY